MVNSIEVIKSGEHTGKLRINVSTSPFASRNIVADIKDVQSVVSLANDDLGDKDTEGNIIMIKSHYDESGLNVTNPVIFTLPGDAYRDTHFMEWILAEKGEDESTSADFNDLVL